MRRWVWLLCGVLVGAVLTGLAWVVTSDLPRRSVDLDSWVESDDAYTRSVVPNAREATDEVCGADLPCTQAVVADTLTLYRFADRGDAADAARRFAGESYRSGWIVVRFEPGRLTSAERTAFVSALDCVHVGVAEGGLEC